MNKNLKEIHNYLLNQGWNENDLKMSEESSVGLAMEICEYAHREQKRENGERYSNHPIRVLENYRNLVGIRPNDFFCIDDELMQKYKIPFKGVQEVCLLHDVVEDTELTLNDIYEMYTECGFKSYYKMYIENALKRITHDKNVPYLDYIKVCLENPISAMVKMMDLQDNLRVIDLVELNQSNFDRSYDYLRYIYIINDAYNFVERVKTYKNDYKTMPMGTIDDLLKI